MRENRLLNTEKLQQHDVRGSLTRYAETQGPVGDVEGDEDDGEHDPGVRAKYLEENAVEEWTFNSRNGTISSFSPSFYLLKTSIFPIFAQDVRPAWSTCRCRSRASRTPCWAGTPGWRAPRARARAGGGDWGRAHTGVVNQLKCSCLHLILI